MKNAFFEVQQLMQAVEPRVRGAFAKRREMAARFGVPLEEAFLEQSPVRITHLKSGAILPSKIRHYAKHALVRMTVKNEGRIKIDSLQAAAYVPGMMAFVSEVRLEGLRPGASREILIPATLVHDKLFDVAEVTPVQVEVELKSSIDGVWRSEDRVLSTVVHPVNSVDWSDTASVAAFVTPQDPDTLGFAQAVLQPQAEGLEPGLAPIARVLEGLAELGVNYRADPDIPYRAARIDHVQYPAQLLQTRAGDCDDLSVLVAAALQSLGVRGALVASPEHLFVLADTGLPIRLRNSLGGPEGSWVARRGTLWIPIEATEVAKGFLNAWSHGAKEFVRWGSKKEIVDLDMAWGIYPPVPSKFSQEKWDASLLAAKDLEKRLRKLSRSLKQRQDQSEMAAIRKAKKKAMGAKRIGPKLELAILLERSGRWDEAKDVFSRVLSQSRGRVNGASRKALVGLGNVALREGDSRKAIESYRRALKAGGGAAELHANLGLAHMVRGEARDARRAFRESLRRGGRVSLERLAVRTRNPGKVSAQRIASKSTKAQKKKRALKNARINSRELRAILDNVLWSVPQRKSSKRKTSQLPAGGRRGASVDEIAAADLLL